MDAKGLELLKNLSVWVLGVVSSEINHNKKGIKKHITLPEALELIDEIKPERAFFTHMGQKMDYQTLCQILPENIRPCYDGLEIVI